MSCPLPQFPSTGAIPPAEFYNLNGLAEWLNKNPSYKQYFVGYFPYLLPANLITSTLSSMNYEWQHVPLCANVTTLSQQQSLLYNQQIQLFRKVYTHNSNAYVNSVCGDGKPPIYYTFKDYQEKTQYYAGASLINKLYPFKAMAQASSINWIVPFPIQS